MNIAIILEATLGGTRKHVVDLLNSFSSDRRNITFIYSSKRADERFKSDIVQLKNAGFDCIELPFSNTIYHPVNLLCVLRLISIFHKRKLEVIHLHGAIAGAVGRLASLFSKTVRKVIYSPHGGVIHHINKPLIGKIFIGIERLLINSRVSFIAVSTDEKAKLIQYLGIPKERISLIHNGIDLKALEARHLPDAKSIQQERHKLCIDEDDFVILYPALFLEAKGHIHFFNVFLQENVILNSKVKILLAGDGPLRSKVETLVQKLSCNEQVIFLGFVKNMDLYYQISNALLLPSLNEAFGYVLLEAMLNRKVIFATRVGGIKDVVEDNRNGFLFELNQMPELIEAINNFSNKQEVINKLSENTTQILKHKFDLLKTTNQVKLLYLEK